VQSTINDRQPGSGDSHHASLAISFQEKVTSLLVRAAMLRVTSSGKLSRSSFVPEYVFFRVRSAEPWTVSMRAHLARVAEHLLGEAR
jgi:hypothetical protein